MDLWLYTALLFWLLVIVSSFLNKKYHLLFAFFDGLLLAFLCFKLLPETFLQAAFWPGVIGLLLGALAGSALDDAKYFRNVMRSPLWHSVTFSAALLFYRNQMPPLFQNTDITTFIMAFTGGFFLAVACSGILPEQDNPKCKAIAGIFGAAGFMLGTCCLYTM